MPKLGPVPPAPAPVSAPPQTPESTVGVVRMNEVNRYREKSPPGIVPVSEVVVTVQPMGVQGPIFGVRENIVSASPPPPPPPDPIGVIKPKEAFPEVFRPVMPKIGALDGGVVITPAPVAANIPDPPGGGIPLIEIPNVVDPFGEKAEKK